MRVGRLDELDRRPERRDPFPQICGGALRRFHRRAVVTDAIVQYGARPLDDGDPDAFTSKAEVPVDRFDQGRRLGLSARRTLPGRGPNKESD